MRRRDFIALFPGTAVLRPFLARAQQPERIRQVGLLMGLAESDPFTMGYVRELENALQQLGWRDNQNIKFTSRYAGGNPDRARALAAELVSMEPDLIVGHTTPVAAALHQITQTLPVVFVSIADPIAGGFVTSLARPGGNMTGFTNYEYSMGGKWLQILKEIAPKTEQVLLLLNPDTGSYYAEYMRSIDALAPSLSVQAKLVSVHDFDEIQRTIADLARVPRSGLIVLPSAPVTAKIKPIIDLVARYQLPTIYPFGSHAQEGGLVAYGVELNDLFRRAAGYVDRILKGEHPADLPVQAPTKYELVVNLKTARALGLTVSQILLAQADEVIE